MYKLNKIDKDLIQKADQLMFIENKYGRFIKCYIDSESDTYTIITLSGIACEGEKEKNIALINKTDYQNAIISMLKTNDEIDFVFRKNYKLNGYMENADLITETLEFNVRRSNKYHSFELQTEIKKTDSAVKMINFNKYKEEID